MSSDLGYDALRSIIIQCALTPSNLYTTGESKAFSIQLQVMCRTPFHPVPLDFRIHMGETAHTELTEIVADFVTRVDAYVRSTINGDIAPQETKVLQIGE